MTDQPSLGEGSWQRPGPPVPPPTPPLPSGPPPSGPTRGRGPLVAVAIVGALLLGATALGATLYVMERSAHSSTSRELARVKAEQRGAGQEREQLAVVREAGKRYAVDLSTYDHRELDSFVDKITKNATGEFAAEFKNSADALVEQIKATDATSKGVVSAAGIAELADDHAVTVVFLDQTVTNNNLAKPRTDPNRMRLTLVKQGGRWLIDSVELL